MTSPTPNEVTTSTSITEHTGNIHHHYDLGALDSYQFVTFTIGGRRVHIWTFDDEKHPSVDMWTTAIDGEQGDDRLPARLVSGLSNTAALTWDAAP